MDWETVLRELCCAAGVGGQNEAAQVAAGYLRDYCDEVTVDALGNVLGVRRCGREQAPAILLEAHIDEVGYLVTGVDTDGFVRVTKCGGADLRTAPASEVIVWGDQPYSGVICSTPPHLSKGETGKKFPEADHLGIDVGMDAQEAAKHIHPGDRVSFRPVFQRMAGDAVCSKSLDDRAGVASVLGCLSLLKGKELPCDVYAAFCVQEELGCRGVSAAAFGIAPDGAIAVDVSFADAPGEKAEKCGKLAEGPMIGRAPALPYRLSDRLEQLAKKHDIPYQTEVMGDDTGTDADNLASSRAGVPTALLSIPLRYMHTPSEVVCLSDVENTARLMAAMLTEGGFDR